MVRLQAQDPEALQEVAHSVAARSSDSAAPSRR